MAQQQNTDLLVVIVDGEQFNSKLAGANPQTVVLPSGVHLTDPSVSSVSSDGTRMAFRVPLTERDLHALVEWFGSVQVVKVLPANW